MGLSENAKKSLGEIATIAAKHFGKTITMDIIEISKEERVNLHATSLVISHFALAYALLEMMRQQNPELGIPTDYVHNMGKSLGIDEMRRMTRELEFSEGLKIGNYVNDPSSEVKESWKSQL